MEINNIYINFGERVLYNDFKITIDNGKITCIIGKSGCGKTTLLNYISTYAIENNIPIAYVFQCDSLILWQNVYNNVKLIAKQNYEKSKVKEVVNQALTITGLVKYKKYYPNELSGGLRQRVNIARALVSKCEILILDEAFKSLDIKSKIDIMNIVKKLNKKNGITVIMTSHDKEEVLVMADTIFLLGGEPVNIIDKVESLDIENIFKKI